jgi:hypothetical protein
MSRREGEFATEMGRATKKEMSWADVKIMDYIVYRHHHIMDKT